MTFYLNNIHDTDPFLNVWPTASSYEGVDQHNLVLSPTEHENVMCKHTERLSCRLQGHCRWRQTKTERDTRGGGERQLSHITESLSAACETEWVLQREKENNGSNGKSFCPLRSRPLLCSLNRAYWGHCAHWEEDERSHTCLCGLGSKQGRWGVTLTKDH